MQLHRYSMIIARIMVATVFLLNAIGVIDQTQAARELAECGAPANLVPYLMLVGRSVELLRGPRAHPWDLSGRCSRSIRISRTGDTRRARVLARGKHSSLCGTTDQLLKECRHDGWASVHVFDTRPTRRHARYS